jgi:hypothetical protein
MAQELRNTVLSRKLVDLLSNLSDLIGKEIRLAGAEVTDKAARAPGRRWRRCSA